MPHRNTPSLMKSMGRIFRSASKKKPSSDKGRRSVRPRSLVPSGGTMDMLRARRSGVRS